MLGGMRVIIKITMLEGIQQSFHIALDIKKREWPWRLVNSCGDRAAGCSKADAFDLKRLTAYSFKYRACLEQPYVVLIAV